MIYVYRSGVPEPAELKKAKGPAYRKLKEYFDRPPRERSQSRPPFDSKVYTSRVVKTRLRKLFSGRCAYCETELGESEPGDVDHIRPMARAQGLKETSRDHYWWLAYEWENLYLCCRTCNKYKGNRFPVHGRRAPVGARGVDLLKEDRLLLDPCVDAPEEELNFNPDGTVDGVSERAVATIDILKLNRPRLVQARTTWMDAALRTARVMLRDLDPHKWDEESFVAWVMDERSGDPFQAAIRQHIRRFFQKATKPARAARKAVYEYSDEEDEVPVSTAMWIERIEIENFRCLKHVDLHFAPPSEDREPWVMLLGDNGTGKSSLLKAVALTLMQDKRLRRQVVPDAGGCVRRNGGTRSGCIRVHYGTGDPIELRFTKGKKVFEQVGEVPDQALLAYGSSRWLPFKKSKRSDRAPERVTVDRLFYPSEPLTDIEEWLARPQAIAADHFNLLATSLKGLLFPEDDEVELDEKKSRINRRNGELRVRVGGTTVSIAELSDGYRSMFALANDIMYNLSDASFDMDNVEGTVLLDEIEVHLHPFWKTRVVESLRDMFPRVRFLATTHDPLCLHGLGEGEVYRLIRDMETDIVAMYRTDVPKGIRADQLLIGEWFGLSTTRDAETRRMMSDHAKLLVKRRMTKSDKEKDVYFTKELRSRMREYMRVPMEQVAQKAVAEMMPDVSLDITPEARENIAKKVAARLKKKGK
jgi:uncharacterized protein (TIGR02646 family)